MLSRSLSAAIKSGAVAASSAASLAENPHHSAALLAALSSSDPDAALRGIDFVPSALSLRNAMDTAPTAAAAIKCFAWASALPRFRGHKLNDERRYASQHSNLSPANVHILANAFLQAGALDAAMRLLRELPSGADLSAYVSVMLGLCRAKRSIDAIAVLRDMERSNIVPELSTYSMLIEGLGKEHKVKEAFDILQEIHRKGLVAKTSSYSYIICGLAKYGFFNEAVELFEAMAERKISPPLGSCIAILNGYCQDGRKMELAMEFFRKMADEYKCPPSTYAYNVLLMGLKKVDRIDAMREMFLEMRDKGLEPDLVTYSTYILGLCKAGRIDDAMVVKKEMMQRSCSPDSVVYSILINALCKVGKLDDGENMLQEMLDKNLKPDAICFGSLIDCLEKSGRSNDALDLYRKMVEIGCKPDAAVASVMVDSLARRGAVLQALEFFDELLKRDFALPSPVSVNNLVKKIVIGDEVERGVSLLTTMSSRGLRPLQCSYATMVKELCRRRNADETLELVREMHSLGYSMDLACVIEMLCKMRKLDEARELYEEMKSSQRQQQRLPSVSTYNLLLERMCVEGKLGDASDLFQEMIESGRVPDATSYEILIEALCRAGKILQGHGLFKQLVSLGFIPSSDLCATVVAGLCKREDDSEMLLREMIDGGFVPDDVIGDVIRELEARKRRRR